MPNLLLVEDNATLGYALKDYLELKSFQVYLAEDGLKGQAYFEKYPIDLWSCSTRSSSGRSGSAAKRSRRSATGGRRRRS